MKRITKYSSIALLAASACLFTGCSDQFLKDKQNYGNFTDVMYNSYEGAKARVNVLYNYLLPNSTASIGFDTPSAGSADEFAKCTEEYGGFSDYVNPTVALNGSTVPDYIYRENKNVSPYGRIRECNMIIEGVQNSTLSDEEKHELLGQAYFFRAWCYFRLVRIYGGVPIIDKVQNPMIGESGGEDLIVPRGTSKECIDFICKDLDIAAEYLPLRWQNQSADYGRITAGAALALQGRARLLYASPLFNRADNQERWEAAYQSNKAAIETLTAGNFGLAYLDNPGKNGSGWAKMFADYVSPEAVFVTLYNTVKETVGTNYNKNNGWENSIRPANADGGGGKSTTAQMVDLFPMADGMKPSESSYLYDPTCFFLNRDPRFYRTFAFPGVEWRFNGTPANMTANPLLYPYDGKDYALWSYAWYKDAERQKQDNQQGWYADGLGTNKRSVYIRKRSDDYGVSTESLYNYDQTLTNQTFKWCGAPFMEMRYAEVLLNFAEAACGAGHYAEAVAALQQIRQRVGYTSENNYGLKATIAGDRAQLFEAILYERQVELAYEGKRFDDMRRWMLWDGGAGQEGVKASWKVTGFGGNTCTYLGVKPLNGQRRTGLEIQLIESLGTADEAHGKDPLLAKGIERPAAINLMSDNVIDATTDPNLTNGAIDRMANFYRNNFTRKTTRVDGDLQYSIDFKPAYYFIGFKENMQRMNVKLLQTVGWPDLNKGNADGEYDPITEEPQY